MSTGTAFWWIGVGTSLIGAMLIGCGLALGAVTLWFRYGPTFICRRPTSINTWSTYRDDVRDGEGRRVKAAADMRITRLVGVAWRFRWFVGVMTFTKDDPES